MTQLTENKERRSAQPGTLDDLRYLHLHTLQSGRICGPGWGCGTPLSRSGVILINGNLAAFLRHRNPSLRVFLPDAEPERSEFARSLAKKLAELAIRRQSLRAGLLIGEINDAPARNHVLGKFLEEAGFVDTALGFQMRRVTPIAASLAEEVGAAQEDEEPDISETA